MDDRTKAEGPGVQPVVKGTAPELKLFLPGTGDSAEIAYDHIARYRFTERYVKGKKTIDLGCGAGYGTHSLSKLTKGIVGVDPSSEAVAYASWCYGAAGLRYEVGDVTNLPYEDGSFEAAISFEVIEHLERSEALVEEARRLLREDGIFVLSTPDKQTYSNDRNLVNQHHSKEMYPLEFREILERHFRNVQICRQGALAGSIITPDPKDLPEDGKATLESTRFSLPDPGFDREVPTTLYMIAVCTNGPAPDLLQKPHLILDCDRQIYEEHADRCIALDQLLMYHEYERQILNDEWAQHLQEQREREQHLQKRVQQLRHRIDDMQNSRGWRIARTLNGITAGVRRILRRG